MCNIYLNENPAFGNPNYNIVRSLLYMVDNNMMSALDLPSFSTKKCQVLYGNDDPLCSNGVDEHLIYLHVKDDYWCQWVYQFAHEYCHHLINGSLTGEWSQLLWFEETLCELSSIYNLVMMENFCMVSGLNYYAPLVKKYYSDLYNKNDQIYGLSHKKGWLKEYESLLGEEGYKRDLYNAIAVLMYPLFMENPSLWKILLNIGDIRSWNSLEDLFWHLEDKADLSYRESLDRLKHLFFD